MGGEKLPSRLLSRQGRGSPPHGRGKVIKTVLEKLDQRITPAWAGKSWNCLRYLYLTQDHPRMGGEKLLTRAD